MLHLAEKTHSEALMLCTIKIVEDKATLFGKEPP